MLSNVSINILVPFIIKKYIYREHKLKYDTFSMILVTGKKLNKGLMTKIKISIIEQTIHVQIGQNNMFF
jgi:hypothetical protein